MKTSLLVLVFILFTSIQAYGVFYINMKGDRGVVLTSRGPVGFIQKEDGGYGIHFNNGYTFYLQDLSPTGFVLGPNGAVMDTYYIYMYNPETKSYEYRNGKEFHSVPDPEAK